MFVLFAVFTVTNMRTREHPPKGCSRGFAVHCVEFVFDHPFSAYRAGAALLGVTDKPR
jgi:hypothetical protein